MIGIMRRSKDCSVVLQFKHYDFASESTISTIGNVSDNEFSTTEGICMILLPFKVPTIRKIYVEKALENAGTLR